MMNSPPVSMPRVGVLAAGGRDAITDVPGVAVGHCTLDQGAIQTGVTVVRVHDGSHFLHKVPAASSVFNGFGKSVGLMQVDELGVLETPIALTNTFSVPAVAAAQIQAAIQEHPEIGRAWPTVNPLVFECNDGYLNDIQAMAIESAHYRQALAGAQPEFAQGGGGGRAGDVVFWFEGRDWFGVADRAGRVGLSRWRAGALELWPSAQSGD